MGNQHWHRGRSSEIIVGKLIPDFGDAQCHKSKQNPLIRWEIIYFNHKNGHMSL